ncbi:acetylxylan esterase [Arcticibacter sp. MXS-1]|uniref:acetylxylan esterase n=1 Tax=Arcticibacter sp. MXS-1 TaxID=3341726 RepID=UPI0035A98A9A
MKGRFCFFILLISFCARLEAQNSPAPLKLVDFILSPDSENWTYPLSKPATVTITVLHNGTPMKGIAVDYEYGPEMLSPEKTGRLVLKEGLAKINIGSCSSPGFRQLAVKAAYNGRTYSGLIKLGWAPERIEPTVVMPADFNQFWQKARQESQKLPLMPQLDYLKQYSTSEVDVYLLSFENERSGQRIYGFLSKPKAPGKYPVLFSPPGAGVKPSVPSRAYAEHGFIALNIEIHGISSLLSADDYKDISNAFGDYWFNRMDDRDNYYYKKVYLGCLRAIDYLCSIPEFDGRNVVVTGGSQGGALSIVTAGLDKRVTCLAAFYPALADLTGYLHGRAGGWPHVFNSRNALVTNKPENIKALAYYDVVNFAKNISAPGFYSWGYNDTTVPPTSVYAAVNAVTAPKTIVITPISGHWRFDETNQESIQWIKSHLLK